MNIVTLEEKYSSTASAWRSKLHCNEIPLRQLHKFAWLFNSFVANMKETEGLVAKQTTTKKILSRGERIFTLFFLGERHTWKDYMRHPNPFTHPFSQHPYNDFFHLAICSTSHHHVTPWCLQYHDLHRVGIFPLSPSKQRSASQLDNTSTTLYVWHSFILFTMPDWHCFTALSKVRPILPPHTYLLSSYSSPSLCWW